MSADARPRGSAARGRLRIYLGYAPGAGTSCALLSEGRGPQPASDHGSSAAAADSTYTSSPAHPPPTASRPRPGGQREELLLTRGGTSMGNTHFADADSDLTGRQ